MLILGFNCYAHHAAACLVSDGRLVAAAQEERFNRIKVFGGFPEEAIRFCLSQAGATLADVGWVAFHWDALHRFHRRLGQVALHPLSAPRMFRVHVATFRDLLFARREFERRMLPQDGLPTWQFLRVRHHLTHAASSFYVSPYDEAAILTLDGNGELASTTFGHGQGTRIHLLDEINFPHSLGYLFVALTHYLGFKPESDEYKLMSLASYGSDRLCGAFRELIRLEPEGRWSIDLRYFNYQRGGRDPWVSPRFVERFGPPRRPDQQLEQRHMDLAFALQALLEDAALHMTRHLHALTGSRNLCLAGGVALNSVMNGRIAREAPFENVFVQPAAFDAGCCIGAAFHVHHAVLGRPRGYVLPDMNLGPAFDDDACAAELTRCGLAFERLDHEATLKRTVDALAAGAVVGWFQGRMEMGPRALGNRSILADPRRADMKDTLNARVKHRESFRPFAPAVPLAHAREYFDLPFPSPYMLFVVDVLPSMRAAIPAVTHVDGTARVQTVTPEQNPRFHALLTAFGARTGVPVLLNTSFNVMGEPIVCTPGDAVRCFLSTGIDVLVMGNCVACKP